MRRQRSALRTRPGIRGYGCTNVEKSPSNSYLADAVPSVGYGRIARVLPDGKNFPDISFRRKFFVVSHTPRLEHSVLSIKSLILESSIIEHLFERPKATWYFGKSTQHFIDVCFGLH
ncbi:hypothetical protein [Paraburkholderia youngii]|uniref:hypothetical protein n=1 Tax=Paraburkholderia youngii TaxID=2782701 RepID=UPI003D1AA9AC